MKTFKNRNFVKRNYETTNLVFCQAEIAPNENWIECESFEIDLLGCSKLYLSDNVRYFGWL